MRRLTSIRPIWLAIIAAGLAVAGILAAGGYYAVATPDCAACHTKGSFGTATRASAHANVPCVSCHVPTGQPAKAAYGVRVLTEMTLHVAPAQGREGAFVLDERCQKCHRAQIDSGVVTNNGVRIQHATCATGVRCTDCHSTVAHGSTTAWAKSYDMESCLSCHVSKASTACDTCHEGRRPADRIAVGTFATTHGPQWRKTHGMGNAATCTTCHTSAKCVKCHGPGLPHDANFLQEHGPVSQRPDAKCSTCHQKTFCSDCHGLAMPHTTQFTKTHAASVRADRALCNRCHVKTDCETCHVKHVHPGGAIGKGPKQGGAQ